MSKRPSQTDHPNSFRNVVATSHPLAVEAGLMMLRKGGNAIDAAIAAAVTLTVVEPTSNGIGSDAFAIVWDGQQLHGLNGSGRSPRAWTREKFSHYERMPLRGWDTVTVPGAVAAWYDLSQRFGRLPFADLFAPAIGHAEDGFTVTPITAAAWKRAEEQLASYETFARLFLPAGRAPQAGARVSFPEMAQTLQEIAQTNGRAFYEGNLAEKISDAAREYPGSICLDDLRGHKSDWVEPVSVPYHDYRLYELPPNGQGIAALLAVGIAERLSLSDFPVDSTESVHLQIEAMKLAFADTYAHLADPDFMRVGVNELLNPDYLDRRARMIDPNRAGALQTGFPREHGTVYLTAADAEGTMVSFIQSNYHGFGSGIVIPGTGISMQNRGHGFTLERGHPNEVGPGKRPYHTIIPGFVMKQGEPCMSFGVMGGFMQPQGHLQMIARILEYGQHPQVASDAPRWCLLEDNRVALERGFDPDIAGALADRGHTLLPEQPMTAFGGAQLIVKQASGYIAGSDHRKDGCALGF